MILNMYLAYADRSWRLSSLLLLSIVLFSVGVFSQARCNEHDLCQTGCCSKDGFCGTTEEYCGDGCQSTCDFQLNCDVDNPCQDGSCCNKAGFCGFGPDYCASHVCVGNCNAKSECDPGFGSQWANATECPLNACCSDAGYCGITQEFCGDRKIDKRSCDSTNYPLGRVIGYYDAAQQSCNSFSPSHIRTDVYTHINFAYATIDAETFRIAPQFKDDIDIYHKLARLKEHNRSLKIFISVGGWQFGEGPGQQTISEMVASENKQTVFISSLISFISTYEFDGIDFDWRYPGAVQRGGDVDDVKNLVTFSRNLKAALRNNGLGDAFSMTLPATYSYLQYFDLKTLSQHVDWFNFMSFDLHGAFRTPDSWINNKLNSHTNLTEIADAVDLLWRSSVPPSKVNLGLAFYSRTFTASSSDCIHKGCPFDSAGQSWGCSGELGLLSNADIDLMVSSSSSKPGLDKKAAVRTMRRDDQWITYDDQATLQIKVDFARSQCMGGVFVWSSNETRLIKRDFDGLKFDSYSVESCRWGNCDGECPNAYEAIQRGQEGKEDQNIWEDSGCDEGQSRTFCCPTREALTPICLWSDWNEGECQTSCPSGFIEVGSSNSACSISGSQLACCDTMVGTKKIDSMSIWDKCRWEGQPPICSTSSDRADACYEMGENRHVPLAYAYYGSGSTQCQAVGKSTFAGFSVPAEHNLCCKPEKEEDQDRHWEKCFWNSDASNDGHCHASCPNALNEVGWTKVALSDNGGCKTGLAAFCCQSKVNREPNKREMRSYYTRLVEEWANGPVCPATAESDDITKRFIKPESTKTSVGKSLMATRAKIPAQSASPWQAMDEVAYGYITLAQNHELYKDVWDSEVAMTQRWQHLTSDNIDIVFIRSETVTDLIKNDRTGGISSLVCRLDEWDAFMSKGGMTKTLGCSEKDLPDYLTNQWESPEDEIPSDDELVRREVDTDSSLVELIPRLSGGLGKWRYIHVRRLNGKSDPEWRLKAKSYYNGDRLIAEGGAPGYWLLIWDSDDCLEANLQWKADNDDNVPVEGEHLPELQTVGFFWGFLADGGLKAAIQKKGSKPLPLPKNNKKVKETPKILTEIVPNTLNPTGYGRDWVQTYLEKSFNRWQQAFPNRESPMDEIFHAMGSQRETKHMVNTQSTINNMKAVIWGLNNFIGDDKLDDITEDTNQETAKTIGTILQTVYAVFDYLNDEDIKAHMRAQNDIIVGILDDASTLIEQQMRDDGVTNIPNLDLSAQWRNCMNKHYERIVARAQWAMMLRMPLLREEWEDRLTKAFFTPWSNNDDPDDPVEEQYRVQNVLYFLDKILSPMEDKIRLPEGFWGTSAADSGSGDDNNSDDSSDGNKSDPNDNDWNPDDEEGGDSDGESDSD